MTVTTEVSKTTRDFVGTTRRLLIDGQWFEAASGKTFVTTDPATEKEITHVAHGEAEDIDRAVAAARRAFEEGPWRTITPSARGQIIWRLADLLEQHADEFAELEALDNGKPLSVARTADVPWPSTSSATWPGGRRRSRATRFRSPSPAHSPIR
jgi:hypothetical protein